MKKKAFVLVWILATAGIFYFWSLRSIEEQTPRAETTESEKPSEVLNTEKTPLSIDSEELPLKLKSRIDSVLSQIEDMWDPNGTKVKEIGERMDALEVALEENNAELAEKILSEMEVIISEK